MLQIACGYEDTHTLRRDPLFKAAVGYAPVRETKCLIPRFEEAELVDRD